MRQDVLLPEGVGGRCAIRSLQVCCRDGASYTRRGRNAENVREQPRRHGRRQQQGREQQARQSRCPYCAIIEKMRQQVAEELPREKQVAVLFSRSGIAVRCRCCAPAAKFDTTSKTCTVALNAPATQQVRVRRAGRGERRKGSDDGAALRVAGCRTARYWRWMPEATAYHAGEARMRMKQEEVRRVIPPGRKRVKILRRHLQLWARRHESRLARGDRASGEPFAFMRGTQALFTRSLSVRLMLTVCSVAPVTRLSLPRRRARQ